MRVTFIGTGAMGRPMAGNLLQGGHDLVVYNRTRSRTAALEDAGARVAATPADAAADAEVLVTMVSDDAAVEAVLGGDDGALATLPADAVHLSMSTLSTAGARSLTAWHESTGHAYVAGPVFGRPDAAEAAKLRIVVAGPDGAVSRCEPLITLLGQQHFVVGRDPWLANAVKLLGNFMLMSAIEAMAEAFALGRKAGLDVMQLLDVYSALFASPIYANYGRLIAERRYSPPGFRLEHGLKDARLALRIAQEVEAPLPFAAMVHDRLLASVANGRGAMDWAAMAEESIAAAGGEALREPSPEP